MARQPSFFDRDEVAPVRQAAQVRVVPVAPVQLLPPGARPEGWRAPTDSGRPGIREEACVRCGGAACCGDKGQWFCWPCKPADFLSLAQAGRAA
jgi:hypothetical protein